jgi:ABC-2 type transport system ATP-binding protein
VAQALVHRPPVIVLDEPTAGVDVELRQTLWQFIRRLNQDGHTIVLTTHYLEEAESLCSRIAMLKAGRVVALDSTANLLQSHANHALRFRLADGDVLPPVFADKASCSDGVWALPFEDYSEIGVLVDALSKAGCTLQDLEIGKPDLEEVFLDVMRGQAA